LDEIRQTIMLVAETLRSNPPAASIEHLIAEGDWQAVRSVVRGGRLASPVWT
jgi:hypothetical protein